MKTQTKYNIFLWLYRTFMYFVPCGEALWLFLIRTLINNEVGVMQKIGISGVFILAIMVVIAVFFYGKHLDKKLEKINDELLECLDNEKKKELIIKRRKIRAKKKLFVNAVFVSIFVILWILVSCIEKKVVSLRGCLAIVSISMATGLGFNGIAEYIQVKGGINESENKGE